MAAKKAGLSTKMTPARHAAGLKPVARPYYREKRKDLKKMIDQGSAKKRYEDNIISGTKMQYSEPTDKCLCAKYIVRYVISDLLGWTPQDAAAHLTVEKMDALGLTRIVKEGIPIPKDIPRDDCRYMLSLVYPEEIRYDRSREVVSMYERIMDEDDPIDRFPKDYFAGAYGVYKANVLLMYLLSRDYPGLIRPDPAGLYDLFSDTERGVKLLRGWHIYEAYLKLPYSSPLEYLHRALPERVSNPFIYDCMIFRAFARKSFDRHFPAETDDGAEGR